MPQQSALVLGGTGLLGPYLANALAQSHSVKTVGRESGDIRTDLTDAAAVRELLKTETPSLVINCTALTNVDQCETTPEAADELNRGIPETLAGALPADAHLIQISTDQVYPGTSGPYREAEIGPINVYGKSKLAGELAALTHPNALVLRANFFGPSLTPGRSSLSDWMIDSLRAEKPMTLFTDSLFSPLHLNTVAKFCRMSIERRLTGTFNLGARNGLSKADFAERLAMHLGLSLAKATRGESVALTDRAPRPRDMRMRVDAIETALGVTMPSLEAEIEAL